MILYLIQTLLALSGLICIYYAFLRNTGLFQFNRFYLLAALLFSLLIPAFPLEFTTNISELVKPYEEVSSLHSSIDYSTNNVLTLGKLKATLLQRFAYSFFLLTYFIISAYFFTRLCFNLYFLLALSKERGPRLRGMQSILIEQKSNPFSFFNYLFLQKETLEEIRVNESILLHEEAHSLQKHSIDILLIEVLQCLFWFNPIFLLYKKAIKENHEYLADSYANHLHSEPKQYLNDLLQLIKVKQINPLSSSFSYLKIKNRIRMIQQSKPKTIKKNTKHHF